MSVSLASCPVVVPVQEKEFWADLVAFEQEPKIVTVGDKQLGARSSGLAKRVYKLGELREKLSAGACYR